MSTSYVSRISRWALALLSVVLLSAFSLSSANATERIILSLDTVGVAPGHPGELRIWLTNPVDSIAGFQVWIRVNRPNFVMLGLGVDTTGTLLSGWEYVQSSTLGGDGYDLLLTALRNDITPPALPAYAPHSARNLLAKIPVTLVSNPDTLFENTAELSIEHNFVERFSFADQSGNDIVATTTIISDTNCYQCLQWMGNICLAWEQVALPPCDSTWITVDTVGVLDTNAFRVDNSQVILRECTTILLAGDIDLDGAPWTVGDMTELIRYIAGDTSEIPLPTNADINGDCRISWEDAAIFSNYFIHGQPYLDTAAIASCTCAEPIRVCCSGTRGNVTSQLDQRVDISDLSLMVSYMTSPGIVLKCTEEANVNGVGSIDISDLSLLINYLIQGGSLPACP